MEQWRLLPELAKNDLKKRYAGSVLGLLWAYALPLVTLLVFRMVFEYGFHNPPVEGMPYFLWFATAYVPWLMISDILLQGTGCMLEYRFLIGKQRFNVSLLPLVKLLSGWAVHLGFVFLLACMHLCSGTAAAWQWLQVLYYDLAAGAALWGVISFSGALALFFRDMESVMQMAVQILFWVTPVLWREDLLKEKRLCRLLLLNPFRYIVSGYRESFSGTSWFWQKREETVLFWVSAAGLCLAGRWVFGRLRPFFADEV